MVPEQVVHKKLLDSYKSWSLLYKWVKNLWMKLSSISYRINNISELVKGMDIFNEETSAPDFLQNPIASKLKRWVHIFLWMHFDNSQTQKKNYFNKLTLIFWVGDLKLILLAWWEDKIKLVYLKFLIRLSLIHTS